MADNFIIDLAERVREHAARKAPLRIRGGGTKDFYGASPAGEPLDVAGYAGIVAYEPREIVLIALIVSGGHTCLYRVEGFGKYIELGRTRDDAAGEAYDKVSKLLGLGYPGGPVIDTLAGDGNPEAIDFPRAYLPESLDFSFSGLKTAVLNFVKSEIGFSNYPSPLGGAGRGEVANLALINDISASFQAAVVDVLVRKTEWAIKKERIRCVTLSGGVAANSALRRRMQEMADEREVELFMPSLSLCTDNSPYRSCVGALARLLVMFSILFM